MKSWRVTRGLFMASGPLTRKSRAVLLGVPYDGTCSYRPGSRFGPMAIRGESEGVECFSPELDCSLEDLDFHDAGDLLLPFGNALKMTEIAYAAARDLGGRNRPVIGLGGEHLVSLPLVRAAHDRIGADLAVLHFDAHADLREDYEGEGLSHATVMRRLLDLPGVKALYQVGIRSATREEWSLRRSDERIVPLLNFREYRARLAGEKRPLYLSLDLDVLDPASLPGTGTPEPGGLSYRQLFRCLRFLAGKKFAGADVVELNPGLDASGVSTITAAKIVRELLLILTHGSNP